MVKQVVAHGESVIPLNLAAAVLATSAFPVAFSRRHRTT